MLEACQTARSENGPTKEASSITGLHAEALAKE
jgi:hypothetical protein